MTKSKSGFTIVELLIVIVVIAILAAITVVAYNGIQARAKVTKKQTAVSSIVKKIQMKNTELSSQLGVGYNLGTTQSQANLTTFDLGSLGSSIIIHYCDDASDSNSTLINSDASVCYISSSTPMTKDHLSVITGSIGSGYLIEVDLWNDQASRWERWTHINYGAPTKTNLGTSNNYPGPSY